jgi:hypothetical protein
MHVPNVAYFVVVVVIAPVLLISTSRIESSRQVYSTITYQRSLLARAFQYLGVTATHRGIENGGARQQAARTR